MRGTIFLIGRWSVCKASQHPNREPWHARERNSRQESQKFSLAIYPIGVYNIQKKEECTMENKPECCCHKTKTRTEKEYKDLMNRLNRIEGQIRGIKGMLEKDAYCTDIIMQVSAVTAALNSFNRELLSNHIKTCVIQDVKDGKEDTIDDLLKTLQKLMK